MTSKVHITLPKDRNDLDELLRVLIEEFGLSELNVERSQLFGIASGNMAEADVTRLRSSGLVRAIQIDQMRGLV